MKIDDPPTHGIHAWIMTAARQCQLQGISAGETEMILSGMESRLRRKYQPNEVLNAVEKVFSTKLPDRPEDEKWKERKQQRPAPPKSKSAWNERQTKIIAIRHKILNADLWEASPIRIDEGFTQLYCLSTLFPDPSGLVCVGKSMSQFHTAPLGAFRDLSRCSLIVPAYMTSKWGRTQNGKRSMHTKENTGPRRFCVCDFDEPDSDHHASIIWYLRQFWDLAMVLSSGGKSLHAWFKVDPKHEEAFWRSAGEYGADLALARNHSQFVRLPLGTRDNGKRQSVFYFDEEVARS